jgi:membrane fusion protein (multidrug efflux system)
MQPDQTSAPVTASPKRNRRPVFIALGVGLAAWAGWYVFNTAAFNRTHETTDNAAVTGNLVQIAPQVPGTIQKILVNDNDTVKAGQLLFVLDDAKYRVALEKAEADLAAAVADAKAAGFAIQAAAAISEASHLESQGLVSQGTAGIANSAAAVEQARAGVLGASASALGAQADIESARADISAAEANLITSQRQTESAQQAVSVAEDAVRSAEANLAVTQSQVSLAETEYKRNRELVDAGAISRRQFDQSESLLQQQRSLVQSAAAAVTNARDQVNQRKADLAAQQARVAAAKAAVRLSQSKLRVAEAKASSSTAGVHVAEAQVAAAQQALAASRGKLTQSEATGQTAEANAVRISQSEAARDQAFARIKTAKATVDNAKLDLSHTRIYAPKSGQLGRRTAQIGAEAQANVALVSLVPAGEVFVTANFKETQTHRIKPGDRVEIEVDGLPAGPLEGKVESIASATGSTFTLLPPDNATGNFVKVVQRIPVKIAFVHPEDAGQVRVGMSVTAIIRVGP